MNERPGAQDRTPKDVFPRKAGVALDPCILSCSDFSYKGTVVMTSDRTHQRKASASTSIQNVNGACNFSLATCLADISADECKASK